jgi:hypothetical protein
VRFLGGVDGDEVSVVRRAANKRRFLLLKGDDQLDSELDDILEVPWEREGALLDEIRKDGIMDETVERAVVAAVRLLKGVEGEFSPELVEKLGTELYGRNNPKLNSTSVKSPTELFGDEDADEDDSYGSASGADKDGSGSGTDLEGTASAPKVAQDSDGNDAEPDDDADDSKGKKKKKLPFGGRKAKPFSKAETDSDSGDVANEVETNEGGTVEVQVPVRKEDGTWDLSGVPVESRPFFEEIISKADKTESELAETREELAKSQDDLRHRDMIQKAASYSHVAPTDDLAPILKEASEKFDPETFEKLEALLSGAEERVAKGGLFTEMGRASLNDGETKEGPWAQIEKMASDLVEKSGELSQEQALDRVLKTAEGARLYERYQAEEYHYGAGNGGVA